MKTFFTVFFIFLFSVSFSQHNLSGKVTDQEGEPLPGATILIKGTTNGVISDFNGNYELTGVAKGDIVVFSYIGFISTEFVFAEQSTYNVVLEKSEQELEGITVRGFAGVVGKSRKRTESIQRTPESVTALNAKGIESAGITDLISFSTLVPNLKFNTQNFTQLFQITKYLHKLFLNYPDFLIC